MHVIAGLFVVLVALFWSIVTTIAGLVFIPIILLLTALGLTVPTRKRTVDTPSNPSIGIESSTDHHVHVPIEQVPSELYEQYSLYLKSPEWRALRKLVLKRDKYKCVDCGVRAYHHTFNPTGAKLQVHHIHYDGIETMTFTTDQCVSVCHRCHDIRHGR